VTKQVKLIKQTIKQTCSVLLRFYLNLAEHYNQESIFEQPLI